jgi:hypothetical protein
MHTLPDPRAQRKPAPTEPETAALAAFHDECGGVLEIKILRKERDAPALLLGVTLGDPRAIALCRALSRWADGIERCRPVCFNFSCDRAFAIDAMPAAFMVAAAYRDDARHCLISGICGNCAAVHSDIEISGWLRRLWPDGRIIDQPRAEGGRA